MSSEPDTPQSASLPELQEYVAAIVKARGFDGENVEQRFMLLLEECGEFARAARKQAGIKFAQDTHTADLDAEAADVFIILLGMCNMMGIDLEKAFRAKEERNKQRTWK